MKIKLEITGKSLTNEQKEAIVGKLQEIKTIVNNRDSVFTIKNEREERKSKLGVFFDKLRKKPFTPHLQSENETLPQTNLCYEHKSEKEFPTGSEDFLRGQASQTERKKARLNAISEDLKEECRLLGEALGKGFHLGCKCSQELKNPQLSVSMPFLSQVATFQGLVSKFLDCYQDTNCNKI